MLSLFVNTANAASNDAAFGAVLSPIINNIINPIIGLAFAIAVVVFVYGVIQMILHGGDPEAQKNGKASILWGLVGIFIMISAWGIIVLVSNTVKGFQ